MVVLPKVLIEFKKDFLTKELIPSKVMFAFLMAAAASLYPFLTLHLKSLGITAAETAIIYALLPLIAFLAPPVTGILADKFGHLKIIFTVMCILAIIVGDCLMFVPSTRIQQAYSSPVSWRLSCSHQELKVQFEPFAEQCNLKSTNSLNISFTINNCMKKCLNGSSLITNPCFSGRNERCIPHNNNSENTVPMSFLDVLPLNSATSSNLSNSSVYHFSFVSINGDLYDTLSCGPIMDVSCAISCSGTLLGSQLCQNLELNNELTFWLYLFIRVILAILSSSVFVLFESITLEVLKPLNADYGLQKVWGAVAACLFSPLTGFLIDFMSAGKDQTDYSISFYIYSACRLLMAISVPFLPMEFKLPAQTITKDVKTLLKNRTFAVFIVMMFLTGAFWGYLEGFLFWFLQELNASQSLMGLTVTVGGVASLPILVLSGLMLRKFGHVNVIVFGLIIYGVRFVGYSFIWNPYYCLPFEALEAFTSMLQLVAAVTYTAKLAPPTILASAQGIMVGVHYGIGRGAGSLVGGYLMSYLGTRASFRIMGTASFIVGFIYLLIYHFILKKDEINMEKDISNKENKVELQNKAVTMDPQGTPDDKIKSNVCFTSEETGDQQTSKNLDQQTVDSRKDDINVDQSEQVNSGQDDSIPQSMLETPQEKVSQPSQIINNDLSSTSTAGLNGYDGIKGLTNEGYEHDDMRHS